MDNMEWRAAQLNQTRRDNLKEVVMTLKLHHKADPLMAL